MVKVRDSKQSPSGEDASKGDSLDQSRNLDLQIKTGQKAPPEGPSKPEGPPNPLGLARDAYTNSTRFLDSSLRVQWERNERAFQSRHPTGSKYLSPDYRTRSRIFRPKTRSMIRSGEAQAAASYFSNETVVDVKPWNDEDEAQQIAAKIYGYLLQYRLTSPSQKHGIPWFQTLVGAVQDAQKYGVVISKQWWEYEERAEEEYYTEQDPDTGQSIVDEDGEPAVSKETTNTIVRDRPHIDLYPPELVRIDRAADWRDPINSSPFCILINSMYLYEVREKIDKGEWLDVNDAQLKLATTEQIWDTTRAQREGYREDSKESDTTINDFTHIFVHENFMRWGGREWVWYTAGTSQLLSNPLPLEEIYHHCKNGERPVVMGSILIESHKVYPAGKPQLIQTLQSETNDIANLRIDNIKLAISKRYLAKRGRNIDLRSLTRVVPGAITLVTDINEDIKEMESRDVTSSSFQEQNLLNLDIDDVAGIFSQGTVQANRRMNETVGGMQMLSGAANLVAELDLRTFTETWVEPVLRQVINMERAYETDRTLIALAASKARVWKEFTVNSITREMMDQELLVRVNVGIGATDPKQRLEKFAMATKVVSDLLGERLSTIINAEEVVAEVFGPAGYRDGRRFFNFDGPDPMVKQLMEELKKLQQELESKKMDNETKMQVAELSAKARIMQQLVENKGAMDVTRLRVQGQSSQAQEKSRSEQQSQAAGAQAAFGQEALKGLYQITMAGMKDTDKDDGKSERTES